MADTKVTAYGTPNGVYAFPRNADGTYETGQLIECVRKVTYKLTVGRQELAGDNGICDVGGRKAKAEVTIEHGGEDIPAHALLSGATQEESVSPEYTKVIDRSNDHMPEFGLIFLVEGNHAGGLMVKLPRCTFTDTGPSESATDAFTMSNVSGIAIPGGDDGRTIRELLTFADLEDAEISTTWDTNP